MPRYSISDRPTLIGGESEVQIVGPDGYVADVAPKGCLHVEIGDNNNIDAFGRLRISRPFSLFSQDLQFGIGQLFWNTATSGTASAVTHNGPYSGATLTCGTEDTAYCIRQTYDYFHYTPGKSHLAFATGVFGIAVAGVRRRAGYFETNDGIFFEQNGTTDYAWTVRTSTSGSPSDAARVAQASWNLDPLDGSGPSGITLDGTKAFVLVFDLQWLGFGRVRVGFDISGVIYYVHEFLHANVVSAPYMSTGSLPLRYEIANTSAQGGNHTLHQGCSTVIGEGSDPADERRLYFSASSGTTSRSVTTRRAVISIRPKATVGPSAKINRIPIDVESFSVLTGTNDCFYEIVYNPTLTVSGGALTWSDPSTQSGVEYCIHGDANAGAFTGGIVTQSGYLSTALGASRLAVLQAPLLTKLPITLDMNGANPIAISLVLTSMTGTSSNAASISWNERR